MSERFYTVAELAALFKQDAPWVYRHRFGFLRPAARCLGARTLLFDKLEVERIIAESAAKPVCHQGHGPKRLASLEAKRQNSSQGADGPLPGTEGGNDGEEG